MNTEDKIKEILKFITAHPESTASRTIIKRHLLPEHHYETSKELSIDLKNILKDEDNEEVNFCYYLVK